MNSAFITFRCSRHFLSFSSSCFFFNDKFCSRRNRRVVPSTPSSPRSAGTTWRGASPAECRTVRSLRCGPGSKRLPGRTPGSGGFCARRPSCCSCSTPSLVLVTVLCARRLSCAVSTSGNEWWDTVGQHRSNRLLLVSQPRTQTALPSPPRGSAFSQRLPARLSHDKATLCTKRKRKPV